MKVLSNLIFILIVPLLIWIIIRPAYAFEITSDPQYVVINFSDTFHFLDWYAEEEKWQREVKPKAIQRLRNIKSLLTTGKTPQRQLAWSTLLEYTNYPPDVISPSSPYIVRVRRIMELAEDENFPVFIPLNGIQWWDELPEFWNWWDSDGNQTPGCTNNDYSNCGFKKLKDPEYRQRFIKGYNPDNKWNVDWQDWKTPMKFVTRNWGSGDFLVAPSPDIVSHPQLKNTFQKLQKSRYEAIINQISAKLDGWEKNDKQHLFAGLSIGTEVTLNGAIKPGDNEFKPYGYRAIQDTFCPKEKPECGEEKNWSSTELHSMRQKIIFRYFNELARIAAMHNIPKQRVYSHVWSEAEPGEIKYTNAISASVTYYSRPGMSIYGKATDPLGFSLLYDTLKENGFPAWAAPEYAPLTRDTVNWRMALTKTLDSNIDPAKLIDVYNEADILNTPAIPELKNSLMTDPAKIDCKISEIVPVTDNRISNPPAFSWKPMDTTADNPDKTTLLIWNKNTFPAQQNENVKEYPVQNSMPESVNVPPGLERGFYHWAIKHTGCGNTKWTISTPRIFYVFPPLPETHVPGWVRLFLKLKGIYTEKLTQIF